MAEILVLDDVVEYCAKPIDRQELEDKVEKALKNKSGKSATNSVARV